MRSLWIALVVALVARAQVQGQQAFSAPKFHLEHALVSSQIPPDTGSPSALRTSHGQILAPDVLTDIQALFDKEGIPGMAIVLVKSEGEDEYANFGVKGENGEQMTSDTLFTIASCSKAFLTAAMGVLMDDFAHGRNMTALPPGLIQLDWDSKVKDVLPEKWKLMDEWAQEKAALKDVFSHVSGLPRHDYSYWRGDTPESVLKRLHLLRPAFELREQYSYNNIMYMLGLNIIETYAGVPYPSFIHDRLFAPLNMSDSTFSPTEAHASGKATHTFSKAGRRIPWWFTEQDYILSAGPGGVIASAEGLAKWVRTLLHAGVNPTTNITVVPKEAFKFVTTARAVDQGAGTASESISGYGLGWMRVSYQGRDIVWHSGSVPGIGTLVMFAPHDGIGLALLTNRDSTHVVNKDIAWRVFRAAFGIPEGVPGPELADLDNRSAHGAPSKRREELDEAQAAGYIEPPPAGVDFTGAYAAAGYGPGFALCSTQSTSHTCLATIATFRTVQEDLPTTSLFAIWPRLWSSSIRLDHFNGTRFRLKTSTIFEEGYGRNQTAFEMPEGADDENGPWVDFVVEEGEVKGAGLRGTVGLPTMTEKKGGSVEEVSDAWFVKT